MNQELLSKLSEAVNLIEGMVRGANSTEEAQKFLVEAVLVIQKAKGNL